MPNKYGQNDMMYRQGMSENNRLSRQDWQNYEYEKKLLQRLNLSPEEYEQAIRRLVERLKV